MLFTSTPALESYFSSGWGEGGGSWQWGRGGSEKTSHPPVHMCDPWVRLGSNRLHIATILLHKPDFYSWLNTNFQSACHLVPGCSQSAFSTLWICCARQVPAYPAGNSEAHTRSVADWIPQPRSLRRAGFSTADKLAEEFRVQPGQEK